MSEVNKEIEQYKKEMETYPIKKKRLLILALIFFGVALILLISTIILALVNNEALGWLIVLFIILIILFVVAGIAILIFRYDVYLLKTANRMRIINKEESIQKEKENPHSKDNKIGF